MRQERRMLIFQNTRFLSPISVCLKRLDGIQKKDRHTSRSTVMSLLVNPSSSHLIQDLRVLRNNRTRQNSPVTLPSPCSLAPLLQKVKIRRTISERKFLGTMTCCRIPPLGTTVYTLKPAPPSSLKFCFLLVYDLLKCSRGSLDFSKVVRLFTM